MADTEKIQLGDQVVTIDPMNLKFNENTLSQYLQLEGGYYDNFGAHLATAEKMLQQAELYAERLYATSFAEWKDNGGSDKLAEARAKADTAVIAANEVVIEAKYIVKRLQQHLRAWDKNHDNAQSLGHMLRKQIDKMNAEIYMKKSGDGTDPRFDAMVEEDLTTRFGTIEESV